MAKDHPSQLPVLPIRRGAYVARFATSDQDLDRAARLRHQCFVTDAGRAALPDGRDQDQFDALCDHVIVEDAAGEVVCCFRLLSLESGADIHMSYSAQYYDLASFLDFNGGLIELGRFCVESGVSDPDVLRIAWGALAAIVDARAVQMLFGCSSFAGTDPEPYGQAFDLLAQRHLAPNALRPRVKSEDVVSFGQAARPVLDRAQALAQIPPLLKTYLTMGGWVSDHAVVDRQMNTLHVFTALEIAAIPSARAKALRAIAR